MKFLRGGERDEALFPTIEANIRFPRELIGVVTKQLAGCLSSAKMVRALIDRYGINTARQPGDRLVVHSGGGYGPLLSDPRMRSAPTCVTATSHPKVRAITMALSRMTDETRALHDHWAVPVRGHAAVRTTSSFASTSSLIIRPEAGVEPRVVRHHRVRLLSRR
ncbi:hypothetical protein J2W40_002551 [Sphingobium xenophagum]|uniref:Uncharacterized protein n=1 Tax=Sphingobium xenophagum TaxID=121428 RepID=A0ABU1X2B0_SPHXE|nr:hypothetical protein [Sphingobium xenophagum]MDR7155715.1 hypothetical protein [Sphingobium xenophagum]